MQLVQTFSLRILVLLLAVGRFVSNCPADQQSPDWFESEVTPDSGGIWYRAAFDLQKGDGSTYQIMLTADATCSLYVNSQRILKFHTFKREGDQYESRAFDLTELMRSGRNLVAIEADSAGAKIRVGLRLEQLKSDATSEVVHAVWKKSAARPPVGWQQTDFNDRDWPAATAADPSASTFQFLPATDVEQLNPMASPHRNPFRFVDGDHVVLLGATFFEREQQFGHLEAALSGSLGSRRVTFRNLGWDADTVFADSRGIFDSPAQGYMRMIEQIRAEEPSVIVVCYGQNEALNRKLTTADFQQQLRRLLDDLSTTGAAVVLVSPHSLLPAQRPVPSPARFNGAIHQITDAIEAVAKERNLPFVNLFDQFEDQITGLDRLLPSQPSVVMPDRSAHPDLWNGSVQRWTQNGLHFTDRGYQVAGLAFLQRLIDTAVATPSVTLNLAGKSTQTRYAEIRNVQWPEGESRTVTFDVRAAFVSCLPTHVVLKGSPATGVVVSETVTLKNGESQAIDVPLLALNPETSDSTADDPMFVVAPGQQYQDLVDAIVRKNELYFHRWRPQNITYLFGFRKHEQGNNATEIAQFDPFIQELESSIYSLQSPHWRRITVTLPAE